VNLYRFKKKSSVALRAPVRVVSIAPVLFFAFGVKTLSIFDAYYLCLLFLCVVTLRNFTFFLPISFFSIAAWDNTHLIINQTKRRRRRRRRRYVKAFPTFDERADDNNDHRQHQQRYRRD
jgi:Flp pilus assembly protein TadB